MNANQAENLGRRAIVNHSHGFQVIKIVKDLAQNKDVPIRLTSVVIHSISRQHPKRKKRLKKESVSHEKHAAYCISRSVVLLERTLDG